MVILMVMSPAARLFVIADEHVRTPYSAVPELLIDSPIPAAVAIVCVPRMLDDANTIGGLTKFTSAEFIAAVELSAIALAGCAENGVNVNVTASTFLMLTAML